CVVHGLVIADDAGADVGHRRHQGRGLPRFVVLEGRLALVDGGEQLASGAQGDVEIFALQGGAVGGELGGEVGRRRLDLLARWDRRRGRERGRTWGRGRDGGWWLLRRGLDRLGVVRRRRADRGRLGRGDFGLADGRRDVLLGRLGRGLGVGGRGGRAGGRRKQDRGENPGTTHLRGSPHCCPNAGVGQCPSRSSTVRWGREVFAGRALTGKYPSSTTSELGRKRPPTIQASNTRSSRPCLDWSIASTPSTATSSPVSCRTSRRTVDRTVSHDRTAPPGSPQTSPSPSIG